METNTSGSSIQGNTLFQQGEGGSSPTLPLQKTLWCRVLTLAEANAMLDKWHYLGGLKTATFAYGHNEGCCLFGVPRSRVVGKDPGIIELVRMVGMPGHKWSMSSLMAQAVKEASRRGYTQIITYADQDANHTGKVYLAANWKPVENKSHGPWAFFWIDGKRVSPKGLYTRHGTQAVEKIKEIYGNRVTIKILPKKLKFVYDIPQPKPKANWLDELTEGD